MINLTQLNVENTRNYENGVKNSLSTKKLIRTGIFSQEGIIFLNAVFSYFQNIKFNSFIKKCDACLVLNFNKELCILFDEYQYIFRFFNFDKTPDFAKAIKQKLANHINEFWIKNSINGQDILIESTNESNLNYVIDAHHFSYHDYMTLYKFLMNDKQTNEIIKNHSKESYIKMINDNFESMFIKNASDVLNNEIDFLLKERSEKINIIRNKYKIEHEKLNRMYDDEVEELFKVYSLKINEITKKLEEIRKIKV